MLNDKNTSLYENIEGINKGMQAELFKTKNTIAPQTSNTNQIIQTKNTKTNTNTNEKDDELTEQIKIIENL